MSDYPERLSRSAEDYLEAIGHLCRKNGQAQVSDVAAMLNVKKPSVTAAMRQLAEAGLISYHPYSPAVLTQKGEQYAADVINAHNILHRFMKEEAGLSDARADETACLIEHILTYAEIQAIGERMKKRDSAE